MQMVKTSLTINCFIYTTLFTRSTGSIKQNNNNNNNKRSKSKLETNRCLDVLAIDNQIAGLNDSVGSNRENMPYWLATGINQPKTKRDTEYRITLLDICTRLYDSLSAIP